MEYSGPSVASQEETDNMAFTVGEEPVKETDFLKRTVIKLVTIVHSAAMAAVAGFVIEEGPTGELGV